MPHSVHGGPLPGGGTCVMIHIVHTPTYIPPDFPPDMREGRRGEGREERRGEGRKGDGGRIEECYNLY